VPLSCALLLGASLFPLAWNTLGLPAVPFRNHPGVPAQHAPAVSKEGQAGTDSPGGLLASEKTRELEGSP
jgi:hypothetical protein